MSEECSEAAPKSLDLRFADLRDERLAECVWFQPAMWDSPQVVLDARFVVDGPRGNMAVSLTCSNFWDLAPLACEVRTDFLFPADRVAAFRWLEELFMLWSERVSPF